MGIEAALAAAALGLAAGGTAAAITSANKKPKSPSVSAQGLATSKTQVDDGKTQEEKDGKRVGRTALIATSPQGVLGSPSVGRRKLLGN